MIEPSWVIFDVKDNIVPVSTRFDDVYFSKENGRAESEYVFFEQARVAEKLAEDTHKPLVIFETGFGTGLNFFVTLQLAAQYHSKRKIHFISVEKYPIPANQLKQIYHDWSDYQALTDRLIAHYPILSAGCHRIDFTEQNAQLDLWLGDINAVLPDIAAPPQGLVDVWYLDGFTPAKNPQMWSDTLFSNMARLSRDGATMSTFTSAGLVRRGLLEQHFKMQKVPGFGRKRHMLTGRYQRVNVNPLPKCFIRHPAAAAGKQVTIIGAGIAGLLTANALLAKGFRVKLVDTEKPGSGASGNPVAAVYPQLHAETSLSSQFYLHCFDYAKRFYGDCARATSRFSLDWCGVVQLAFNKNTWQRYEKIADNPDWPKELVHFLMPADISEVTGLTLPYSGLWFPTAGWVSPVSLTESLLAHCQSSGRFEFQQKSLCALRHEHDAWQVTWSDAVQTTESVIVIATGAYFDIKTEFELPITPTRGQIEYLPNSNVFAELKTVLCHKGYVTPGQGVQVMGSTFVKGDTSTDYRDSEAQENIRIQQQALIDWSDSQHLAVSGEGRASLRAAVPDHLPIMGAVPDVQAQRQQFHHIHQGYQEKTLPAAKDLPNLFILSGLGSRGVTSAPLLAEALACQIAGEPLPLPQPLLNAINPNRFVIRACKQGLSS